MALGDRGGSRTALGWTLYAIIKEKQASGGASYGSRRSVHCRALFPLVVYSGRVTSVPQCFLFYKESQKVVMSSATEPKNHITSMGSDVDGNFVIHFSNGVHILMDKDGKLHISSKGKHAETRRTYGKTLEIEFR